MEPLRPDLSLNPRKELSIEKEGKRTRGLQVVLVLEDGGRSVAPRQEAGLETQAKTRAHRGHSFSQMSAFQK